MFVTRIQWKDTCFYHVQNIAVYVIISKVYIWSTRRHTAVLLPSFHVYRLGWSWSCCKNKKISSLTCLFALLALQLTNHVQKMTTCSFLNGLVFFFFMLLLNYSAETSCLDFARLCTSQVQLISIVRPLQEVSLFCEACTAQTRSFCGFFLRKAKLVCCWLYSMFEFIKSGSVHL